jgi:hypothetical protein
MPADQDLIGAYISRRKGNSPYTDGDSIGLLYLNDGSPTESDELEFVAIAEGYSPPVPDDDINYCNDPWRQYEFVKREHFSVCPRVVD